MAENYLSFAAKEFAETMRRNVGIPDRASLHQGLQSDEHGLSYTGSAPSPRRGEGWGEGARPNDGP